MRSYTDWGYLITRCAHRYPDRIALSFKGWDLTYRELDAKSTRLANSLVKLGVKKGDKVASLLRNCNQSYETYFGIAKMGGVSVQLNPRLVARELTYILDNSDASVLIFDGDFRGLVEEIRPSLAGIKTYIIVGDDPPKDTLRFDDLIENGSEAELDVEIDDDDPCTILYTSGTTGRPKGVVRTHRNNVSAAVTAAIGLGRRADDVELLATQAFGVGLFNFSSAVFLAGARLILMRQFDPREALRIIQDERVTMFYGVHAMWNMILEIPDLDRFDTSSLRQAHWGGEPMTAYTAQRILDRFGPILTGVYGLSEGGLTFALPEVAVRKPLCCGKPVGLDEIRIVDDDDREVPPGQRGEIVFRGPSEMVGYYKDPEATAQTLRNGWLHTGDVGYVDEEGDLFVIDRKKQMLISGGENIYPAEIEQVLIANPKILEAAVVGVPDAKWGQSVKAVVVLKPGETMTADEVIEHCRQNLASYKKPKLVQFVDSLPKNVMGKIDRAEVRDMYGRAAGT